MVTNPYLRKAVTIFQKFTRAFGVEINRYNFYHSNDVWLQKIIEHFQIKTILDVGANSGQYAEEVFYHGFKGEIHSFEPISNVFQKLQKKSKRFKNWQVHNLGVGQKKETLMINVSENLVSS